MGPLIAILGLCVALAGAPAPAFTAEEQPYAERVGPLISAQDWAGAARVLEEGYEATGSLRLLQGWAEAEKHAGNCEKSLELYDEFFAKNPPADIVEAMRARAAECRKPDESEVPAAPSPAPQNASPDPVQPAEPPPSEQPNSGLTDQPPKSKRRWQRDPAAAGLVGSGGALLGTGLILAIVAEVGDRRLDDAQTHGDFEDQLARSQRVAYASYGLLAAGSILVLAGIGRYGHLARKNRRARASVVPSRRGIAVMYSGRF